MHDIKKLENLYGLKNIYRVANVKNREESVAEHCRSMLVLADYFIQKMHVPIDKQRVYDLIIYHDLIEIETGDVPIHDEEKSKNKKSNEKLMLPLLIDKLPVEIHDKFISIYEELEHNNTIEAKFVHAIDKLDPMIQCLYDKDLFIKHNYSETFLRTKKQKHVEVFPEINAMYEDIIQYYKENGYLNG